MADTSGTLQPIPSQNGPTRDGPVVSTSFDPPPPTPEGFYDWPGLAGPLPDDFLEKIRWHRNQLPKGLKFIPASGGYSHTGPVFKTPEICTPEDRKDEAFCKVLERMYTIELSGEGNTTSIMTGDGAIITWGRGLGYAGGGSMAKAFTYFLARSDGARMSFLDHGVALIDKQLKVVDTGNNAVLVHLDAAKFLSGREPAEAKKQLLTIFPKVTQDFGVEAETAQWQAVKENFLLKKSVREAVAAGWAVEAVCYVVHSHMWGWSTDRWPEFMKTGGSLAQILRTEVNSRKSYTTEVTHSEGKGTYRVVTSFKGGATPAPTMLRNMGHGIMLKLVRAYASEAEMKIAVQPGDIVFDMGKATPAFYIMRGSSAGGTDEDIAFRIFVETHHFLEMGRLIAKLKSMAYADVKKRRDWYARPGNETQAKYGNRILTAMDARLHQGEGEGSRWVLDSARYVGISEDSCWDQYAILKQTLGIA